MFSDEGLLNEEDNYKALCSDGNTAEDTRTVKLMCVQTFDC